MLLVFPLLNDILVQILAVIISSLVSATVRGTDWPFQNFSVNFTEPSKEPGVTRRASKTCAVYLGEKHCLPAEMAHAETG